MVKIAASLVEYGWTAPVMVADDGEIVAGHGRLLAAQHLGLTEVPIIRLSHLTPVRIATEGALWGSVTAHGFLPDTVIVSDDAGQFDVGRHGLCWIHAERLAAHPDRTFADAAAWQAPPPQARHLHRPAPPSSASGR